MCELSRLIRAYAENSALESIALKVGTILPQLLQKPSQSSNSKELESLLERHLILWKNGKILTL